MTSKSQIKRRVIQSGKSLQDLMDAALGKPAKIAPAPKATPKAKPAKAPAKPAKAPKAAKAPKSSETREAWLQRGVVALTPIFVKAGHTVPAISVSCSWPGGGSARKRIGECWQRKSSEGAKHNAIFISPVIADPVAALDILAHEMVHAVDDCQNGHKAAFTRIAKSVGLTEGKPSQVRAGAELRAQLVKLAADLGPYNHSAINLNDRKKKNTYLIKCSCANADCGAVWRMTTSWIDRSGEFDGLKCPVCGESAQPGDTEESSDE